MSIKKEVCYSFSKIMFMSSRTKVEENYVDNRFRSSFSASISTDVSIQFMLDQNFIPILRITALFISLKVNISNYPSPRTLLKEIDLWYEQYITLITHLLFYLFFPLLFLIKCLISVIYCSYHKSISFRRVLGEG